MTTVRPARHDGATAAALPVAPIEALPADGGLGRAARSAAVGAGATAAVAGATAAVAEPVASQQVMTELTARLRMDVEPALAEAIVWRALMVAEQRGERAPIERHHRRATVIYDLPDPVARNRGFVDLARREVDELGLLTPIVTALAERPLLAATVSRVLVGQAGGRAGEGITCDRAGAVVGLRLAAALFDQPDVLLAWCRHGLGHAEDTLDPAFGFQPGIEAALDVASFERFHLLWDISVDGRAARAGLPSRGVTAARHADELSRVLGHGRAGLATAVASRLWEGPRPSCDVLRRLAVDGASLTVWARSGSSGQAAADPGTVLPMAGPGSADSADSADSAADDASPDRGDDASSDGADPDLLPAGRCPLCRFPGALRRPPAQVALAIQREYPTWDPALGVCERCLDRALLTRQRGGVA